MMNRLKLILVQIQRASGPKKYLAVRFMFSFIERADEMSALFLCAEENLTKKALRREGKLLENLGVFASSRLKGLA
jgi:hypothetical protein